MKDEPESATATADPLANLDIGNYRIVCGNGRGTISVMNPPREGMTPTDAMILAAWLVALAEVDAPPGVTFDAILEKVRNT